MRSAPARPCRWPCHTRRIGGCDVSRRRWHVRRTTCSIEAWAAASGLSSRSLARRWQAETGTTLSQWRQRLRVLLSLPRLLAGEPVLSVALSMGYDTPSAFIAVFKREMGVTPARYAKGDGGD